MTETPISISDRAPDPAATTATTGHPAVDGALRALDDAAPTSPAEQIPMYEAAHRVLQQTLDTIDQS